MGANVIDNNHRLRNSMRLLTEIDDVYQNSLTSESPRIKQPVSITIPLRPHQAATVARMYELERLLREGYKITGIAETFFSRYAILGDVVGSGKSLCILSYLAYIKECGYPSTSYPPYYHPASTPAFFSLVDVVAPEAPQPSNLIIVPHILYRQWMDYCSKQTTLNVFFCKTRRNLADISGVKHAILSSDVTIVSNNLYNELQDIVTHLGLRWERCFIDEVDTINIPSTKLPIAAQFTWFVTATWLPLIHPTAYINTYNIAEYLRSPFIHADFEVVLRGCLQKSTALNGRWASMRFFKNYISPHPMRVHTVIRTSNAFRIESMDAPPIVYTTIRCAARRHATILSHILSPAIQMALNADDMETVFKQLGVTTTTESNLLRAVTDMQQKELTRLEQTLQFKSAIEYATPQAKEDALDSLREKITATKTQMEGLCNRIKDSKVCQICYDDISGGEMVVPCCHNAFCAKCILTSITYRPTCPLCRAQIKPSELTYLGSAHATAAAADAEPLLLTKSKQLLKILLDDPDSKIIIFSRYDNPFLTIQQELEANNIRVAIVNGNKDYIHNLQAQFTSGSVRVLLLNSQFFCAGMNLDAATHVVLYHAGMTYTEEEQLIGRAYRMGRVGTLNVVRLINDGE